MEVQGISYFSVVFKAFLFNIIPKMPWGTFYTVVRLLSPPTGRKALGSIIHMGYDYTESHTTEP